MLAAADGTPRRIPKSKAEPSGGDVMLIINHIDKRLGEVEARIMGVIREGREAHTREHAEQQMICKHSMEPLELDYANRLRATERRDARVKPLVRAADWITNHWQVSTAVAVLITALLYHFGILTP